MSTQGEAMAEQIAKDDVAYLAGPHEPWCNFVAHADCCHNGDDERFSCECGVWQRKQDIAAALAEEREKARAPFLALAQELATVATDHHATVAGDAYADAADRIMAVLEGTYL